ncbi:hypothetical protein ACWDA9_39810 [Streptomyces sp. NPDC001193]
MDLITVVLVVLGVLLPSMVRLIDSAADHNRAAGKAAVIRAKRAGARRRRRGRRSV